MRLKHDESVRAATESFTSWFDAWIPRDYEERLTHYHHDLDFRRTYQTDAFEAGWLVPEWERQLGGQGLGRLAALAVRAEGARRYVPKVPSVQTVGVVVPALRSIGTPAQVERLLLPALRGEEDWCLGMSEPEAGSDLASLRTTAERRGDVFVVNGSKIWTTQADDSAWMLLFCRTDRTDKTHRGITCLLVAMDTPGLTVDPIRVSDPRVDPFCEVHFADVEVPVSSVLGEVGGGWQVAMGSLGFERDMIWINNAVEIRRGLEMSTRLALRDDTDAYTEIGRRAADAAALELSGHRSLTHAGAARGLPLILKLLGSEALQATIDLAASLSSAENLADVSAPDLILDDLEARGATLYGGTSEVQRNIIGERILGLPR